MRLFWGVIVAIAGACGGAELDNVSADAMPPPGGSIASGTYLVEWQCVQHCVRGVPHLDRLDVAGNQSVDLAFWRHTLPGAFTIDAGARTEDGCIDASGLQWTEWLYTDAYQICPIAPGVIGADLALHHLSSERPAVWRLIAEF